MIGQEQTCEVIVIYASMEPLSNPGNVSQGCSKLCVGIKPLPWALPPTPPPCGRRGYESEGPQPKGDLSGAWKEKKHVHDRRSANGS